MEQHLARTVQDYQNALERAHEVTLQAQALQLDVGRTRQGFEDLSAQEAGGGLSGLAERGAVFCVLTQKSEELAALEDLIAAQDAPVAAALAEGLATAKRACCAQLAGYSEGGLVALIAAQAPLPDLCSLILLATPGRPVGRILLDQMRATPTNAPVMAELEAIIAGLEAGQIRPLDAISPVLHPALVTVVVTFIRPGPFGAD